MDLNVIVIVLHSLKIFMYIFDYFFLILDLINSATSNLVLIIEFVF